MFKRIVVAIDGSEESGHALEVACDLAGKYNSEVHLVHSPQLETTAIAVGSGAVEIPPSADKVAESAQLLKFIRSLPDGWDTVVGDRGLKLSGGEKQRTAIARCLLKDPPFVVLDEATSALDSVTESSIQEALDALGSHRTCLVIAHRLGTIRNADNIVVLGDGVVLEQVSVLLFFWS